MCARERKQGRDGIFNRRIRKENSTGGEDVIFNETNFASKMKSNSLHQGTFPSSGEGGGEGAVIKSNEQFDDPNRKHIMMMTHFTARLLPNGFLPIVCLLRDASNLTGWSVVYFYGKTLCLVGDALSRARCPLPLVGVAKIILNKIHITSSPCLTHRLGCIATGPTGRGRRADGRVCLVCFALL